MVLEWLDWSKCTVIELKQACIDRGLQKTGKKVDLIARLKRYYEQETESSTKSVKNPNNKEDVQDENGSPEPAAKTLKGATEAQEVATEAQEVATEAQEGATEEQEVATEAQEGATEAEGVTTEAQGVITEAEGVKTGAQGVTTDTQGVKTEAEKVKTEAEVGVPHLSDTASVSNTNEDGADTTESGEVQEKTGQDTENPSKTDGDCQPVIDDLVKQELSHAGDILETVASPEQLMDTEYGCVTPGNKSESGAQTDGEEGDDHSETGSNSKPKFWRGKYLVWHTPYSTEKMKRRIERESVKIHNINPVRDTNLTHDQESEVLLYSINFEDFSNPILQDITKKCSKVNMTAHPLRKSEDVVEFKSVMHLYFKKRSDIAECLPILSKLKPDIQVYHQSMEQLNTGKFYHNFYEDVLGAELNAANATLYAYLPHYVTQDDLWGIFPMAQSIVIHTTPQRSAYVYFTNKAMLNKNINWLECQHVDRKLKKLHFCFLSELLKPTVSEEEFLMMNPKHRMSGDQSPMATTAQPIRASKTPLLQTPSQQQVFGESRGPSSHQKRPLLSTPPPDTGPSFVNQFGNQGFAPNLGNFAQSGVKNSPGMAEMVAVMMALQQSMQPNMSLNNQGSFMPNQFPGGFGGNTNALNPQMISLLQAMCGQQASNFNHPPAVHNPGVNEILSQLIALQNSISRNNMPSSSQNYGGNSGPNMNELIERLMALQHSIGGNKHGSDPHPMANNPQQRHGMNQPNMESGGNINPSQIISHVLQALEAQLSGKMPRDDFGNGRMIVELRKLLNLVSVNSSIQHGIDNLCHSLSKMGYEDQAQDLHAWNQQHGSGAQSEENMQFSPKRTLSPESFDNTKRLRQNPGPGQRPSGLLGDRPDDQEPQDDGQIGRPRGLLGESPQDNQRLPGNASVELREEPPRTGRSEGLLGDVPQDQKYGSSGVKRSMPQSPETVQSGLLGSSPQDYRAGPKKLLTRTQGLLGNAPSNPSGPRYHGGYSSDTGGYPSGAGGYPGGTGGYPGGAGGYPGGSRGNHNRPQGLLGDSPQNQNSGYHGSPGGSYGGPQGPNQQEMMASLSMLLGAQCLQQICGQGGAGYMTDSRSYTNSSQSGQVKQKRRR